MYNVWTSLQSLGDDSWDTALWSMMNDVATSIHTHRWSHFLLLFSVCLVMGCRGHVLTYWRNVSFQKQPHHFISPLALIIWGLSQLLHTLCILTTVCVFLSGYKTVFLSEFVLYFSPLHRPLYSWPQALALHKPPVNWRSDRLGAKATRRLCTLQKTL